MENKQQLSKAEQLHYIKLISNRFLNNPRMALLFNKNKKSFPQHVFNAVNYCFQVALRNDGVYIAENKKTILLFYEQQKLKKNFRDFCRYLKVIKGIPLANMKKVLQNEKEVKTHKLNIANYMYVWFIAQEEGYGSLEGLNEINKMLFKLSNQRNLPILFETSDIRLLRFYKHVGFDVYHTLKRQDETIYFFADKKTLTSQ
ncbi:MAG: hypothetical protein AAF611_01580 [Bacteroidota bacterium]